MRKIITVLLILTLFNICLGFAIGEGPTVTPEPEYHVCGDYKYIILDDGTAEISRYLNNSEIVSIPDELDGIRVTGIGDYAFSGCDSLTGITVPESVTRIGDHVFSDCVLLSSVMIPDSVTSIGNSTFAFDYSLISITIPDSVVNIGVNP